MSSQPAPAVVVDATAVPADRRGVGRYVDELLRAAGDRVAIACQARDAEFYRALAPSALVLPQTGIQSTWRRLLWEQVTLPRVVRATGVRVIHSPHYTVPIFTRARRVVTFHDATFFSDPAVHVPVKRLFFRTWMRISRRLAAAVIVPSRATADEIEHYVGLPRSGPYRVIHHGVDRAVFHPPTEYEVADVAALLDLGDRPWIAFLGTIEPRKNLPSLLRAYRQFVTAPREGETPALVLAGSDGWGDDISPEVDLVTAPGTVLRAGYLPIEKVRAFLGGSQFVAYPSLGEGFGLPVLEGMACGAAVLTTPRLALPEVGGDAVRYAEPDPDSLALAMIALASSPVERRRLGKLGIERAATFTWTACAEQHLAVYRDADDR